MSVGLYGGIVILTNDNVAIVEKLRRIDEFIAEKLAEKQRIVCSMFRVPDEDFNTIVDIASQPEAPQVSDCKLSHQTLISLRNVQERERKQCSGNPICVYKLE